MKRWLAWVDRHSLAQLLGLFVLMMAMLQGSSIPIYLLLAIVPGVAYSIFGNLGPINAFICAFIFNAIVSLPVMLITLGIKLWRNRKQG